MPTIPWITVTTPTTPEVQCMASRLEVKSVRDAPGFLISSLKLWRQARRSPGVLGVALKAEILKGTFWTYSAWTDKSAIYAYAAAEPHKSTVERKRKVMREATFVFFDAPADELPVSWDEIGRRIAEERDSARSRQG
ncbi:DUF3291 domain-containing protein [Nocardia sp. XZ_19_385]|uniref:DUF3291 domain-containing protein n=1 Tax=Nocardia sp. XZ_19_385 TaxID=2769488 RepID=UPI00188FFD04|nr:DUF3291 domain-containing protein [Nocardia sp. XZ_19_385]